MGFEIAVEDERGLRIASVEDPENILHRVLPSHDDTAFRLTNCIDWYGDTTFNRLQIPELRREMRRLADLGRTLEELAMIRKIDSLAERVEVGHHMYLKFYGD